MALSVVANRCRISRIKEWVSLVWTGCEHGGQSFMWVLISGKGVCVCVHDCVLVRVDVYMG